MLKTLSSFMIATTLVGLSMASQASENCPAVSQIKEVSPGVYRADGKEGEWSGVLQGVVADKTPVNAFKMAVAIQEDKTATQTFQQCTYKVGNRETLDMHFTARDTRDRAVQTQGAAWKQEDGPFGLIYNVCENTAPENCTFTLAR